MCNMIGLLVLVMHSIPKMVWLISLLLLLALIVVPSVHQAALTMCHWPQKFAIYFLSMCLFFSRNRGGGICVFVPYFGWNVWEVNLSFLLTMLAGIAWVLLPDEVAEMNGQNNNYNHNLTKFWCTLFLLNPLWYHNIYAGYWKGDQGVFSWCAWSKVINYCCKHVVHNPGTM